MKNLKQTILCAGIILAGLLAACSNLLEPAQSDAGSGNVVIKVSGSNERTVLPAAVDFSSYALEVKKNDGTNVEVPSVLTGITGAGVSVELPAGTYTVTVKAYRTGNILVAKGSKEATVAANATTPTPVVIDLAPFIGEEKGSFSYDIKLPAEATGAALKLKAVEGEETDKEFNLLTSASSATATELAAGYYDMFISLEKGAVESGEYVAVHIYSGMETKAVLDLSDSFAAVNLEPLNELIALVEAELDRVEISEDGSDVSVMLRWVTQEAETALQTALAAAKTFLETKSESQRAVNTVRNTLAEALEAFDPQLGKDSNTWKGLITAVETPVQLTITSTGWNFKVPLASDANVNGTYTVAEDGTVSFTRDGAESAMATGIHSVMEGTFTLNLVAPILGVHTITLTEGDMAAGAADIEYLFSGIWSDQGKSATPALTYISADKWTFSLPYTEEQENGTFWVYDHKAAFFKADGVFFAVGKLETEEAGKTGNVLTVYTADGSYDLTLNPSIIPYVGNWQGGDTIGGTLYINITTWSLENEGSVVAEGEYVWEDNEIYFLSQGMRFATGTINEAKNELSVEVNSLVPVYGGSTQVFTLIASPFIGNWRATLMFIVNIDAAVTGNSYAITSPAGDADGQYIWRVVDGVNTGYFYSNGYPYGVATQSNATRIVVVLADPITAPIIGTISSLTMNKR